MAPLAVVKVNGTAIAQSDLYEKVEGNIYFPPAAVDMAYLRPSETHTYCSWKGKASYYDIVVDDKTVVKDGAWYYPEPKDAFKEKKDFVAYCTFAPLMLVMRRVPLRFTSHGNKPDLTISTIPE